MTTIGSNAGQVTFNPKTGTAAAPALVTNTGPQAVACRSTTACTAVDSFGAATRFDPTSSNAAAAVKVDVDPGVRLLTIACPSATQCTATGDRGRQVSFNPASPGTPTLTTIDPGS